MPGPRLGRQVVPLPNEADFRFTVVGGALYVFGYRRPVGQARIVSLAAGKAKVERVTLLGSSELLRFTQTAEGLMVTPPAADGLAMPYALRVEGTMPLGA